MLDEVRGILGVVLGQQRRAPVPVVHAVGKQRLDAALQRAVNPVAGAVDAVVADGGGTGRDLGHAPQ